MSGSSAWGSIEIVRNDAPVAAAAAPRETSRSLAKSRPKSGSVAKQAGSKPNRPLRSAAGGGSPAGLPELPPAPGMEPDDDVLSIGMVDLGGADPRQVAGPGLDIISLPPPAKPEPSPEEQEAAEVESERDRVEELGGFGRAPTGIHQAVPYFVRVMLRKKHVEAELASVVTQRKRLDQQAEDALIALGEALYVLHKDARLKKLQLQLRAVAETQKQMGAKEAESKKASDQSSRELERIAKEIAKVEREVEPLRTRETEAQVKVDQLAGHIRRKEAAIQKIDEEMKQLRASTDALAVDRIAALEAERAAVLGEVQSRNVQLLPLREDLSAWRREIAKRMEVISALRSEERGLTQAISREQERHRVSAGGARSVYKDAVKALALAARKAELDALAPEASQNAVDAEERATAKRRQERLHRAAAQSYDHASYMQGMYILVGGTALVFMVFAAMIVL